MKHISAAEYQQTAKPAKRHKYRAVAAFRCEHCGAAATGDAEFCICGSTNLIRFASKAEARRYDALRQEEQLGLIRDLRRQVRYPLDVNGIRIGTYAADFTYHRGDAFVVEDTKGVRTPAFIRSKKLMLALYGIDVVEVSA
jgi:hypothetical protein